MGVDQGPGEGLNRSVDSWGGERAGGGSGRWVNVSQNNSYLGGNLTDFSLLFGNMGEDPSKTPFVRTIFILAYSIVFACCFIGNILVIFVILRHRKMRTITNFFLANLAVADLCVGIFCVLPNLSKYLSPYWLLGRVMCKLHHCVQAMSYVASITILSVISVERYFAILHPLRSKQLTTLFLLRVVVTVVWIIAGSCGIPYLITYDTVSFGNGTYCIVTRPYNTKVYVTVNFLLWYLLPLMLMIVMYLKIAIVLWRTSQMDSLHHPGDTRGGIASAGKRQVQDSGKGTSVYQDGKEGKESRIPLQAGDCNTTASSDECEYDPSVRSCKYTFNNHIANATGKNYSTSDGESEDEPHSEYTALDFEDDWPTERKKSVKMTGDCNKQEIKLRKNLNNFSRTSIPAIRTTPPPEDTPDNGHVARKPPAHHRQVKFILNRQHKRSPNNALMARRRVIRLLVTVIIAFALCVLPYHLVMLEQNWKSTDRKPSYIDYFVSPIANLICYFNSGLNPILYAFLSDNFRRSLRDLLTCRRPKSAVQRSNRSNLSAKTLNTSL